jgi:hypothetical protein
MRKALILSVVFVVLFSSFVLALEEYCSDGTKVGECSDGKPIFCEIMYDNDGNEILELVNKSSQCGCDDGYESKWDDCYEIEVDTCTKYYTCPGGTEIEECFPESSESGASCICNDDPAKTCSIIEAPSVDKCSPYYICDDGTEVKWCESFSGTNSGGCGCEEFPEKQCPDYEEPKTEECPKYYTCSDGTQVEECGYISSENSGSCGCISNPEDQCPEVDGVTKSDDIQGGEGTQSENSDDDQSEKIKITSETASDKVVDVLEVEFESVELIEPTQSGEAYIYKVVAKRQAKLLGLFGIEFNVEAEVDADTGDIIKTNQPWWAIFVF